MNQTIKGILPARLITEGITNIQDANKYIEEKFIPYLIKEFGRLEYIENNTKKKVPSAFVEIDKEDIEKTLVVIESRKINNGHSISYKSNYYKLLDKNSRTIALPPGSSVSVIKTIDGRNLYATDRLNVCYALEMVKERHIYSKSIDSDELKPKKREKNKYIPDKTHPWSCIRQKEFRENDKLMKSLEPIYRSPHEAVYS
jgi:hypothetical protein